MHLAIGGELERLDGNAATFEFDLVPEIGGNGSHAPTVEDYGELDPRSERALEIAAQAGHGSDESEDGTSGPSQ
jgi:hypothetical protein